MPCVLLYGVLVARRSFLRRTNLRAKTRSGTREPREDQPGNKRQPLTLCRTKYIQQYILAARFTFQYSN